ncbi:hypothetical protein D9613_010990 [Agrocybe pediades]|uniref:Uncharacterized protein n=1 Tax=Agrocybe pediades TaxID=84607 RepID=A0A8H4VLX2_9AGAR|nr:hypothetical protein D9613_010990 [Agrocybe pediades]
MNRITTYKDKPDKPKGSSCGWIIPWRESPKYDARLLEWLKAHEDARTALFADRNNRKKRQHNLSSKSEYYHQAGTYVLSKDADPLVRRKAKELKREQISRAVGGRIFQWRKEYQDVNQKLGRVASNRTYEDLISNAGQHELQQIEKKLQGFPLWKELHVFFRTKSWANQYHPEANTPTLPSSTASAKASSSKEIIDVDLMFPDVDPQLTLKEEEKEEEITYNLRPRTVQPRSDTQENKNPDVIKVSKRARHSGDREEGTREKRSRHSTSQSTATLFEHPTASSTAAVQLTAAQIHEQTMARLEIERLDRENRRLELEAKNQRAKERYEENMLRKGCNGEDRDNKCFDYTSNPDLCYEAGLYVLSQGEHPKIPPKVKTMKFKQFKKAIYRHIHQWRTQYRVVNQKLGREYSNLTYEDIVSSANEAELKVIKKTMRSFPLWKELHAFWRTNPWANHFRSDNAATTPSSIKKEHESVHSSKEIIDVDQMFPDVVELSPTAKQEEKPTYNFRRRNIQSGSGKRGNKTVPVNKISRRARQDYDSDSDDYEKTTRNKRARRNASKSKATALENPSKGPSTAVQLTAAQIHEQTMARLEIERLDRGNRRLELEARNQRAKERYEERMLRKRTMLLLAKGEHVEDMADEDI